MELLFNNKDVMVARHPLVKLIRLMFYRNRTTLSDFIDGHNRYSNMVGWGKKEAQTDRSNNLKTIVRTEGITFQKFYQIINLFMHWDIVRISITINKHHEVNGVMTTTEETYHSDEILQGVIDDQDNRGSTTAFLEDYGINNSTDNNSIGAGEIPF